MPTILPEIPLAGASAPERLKGCSQTLPRPLRVGQANELAELHRALSDPTRIQMVHMLKAAAQPVCVCDFVAAFDLGQPTISHHLSKLRDAGIITGVRRGIWTFYQLNARMPEQAQLLVKQVP